MSRWVVDTNVPIVANGASDPVDAAAPSLECRLVAVSFLKNLNEAGVVLLDHAGAIQEEYRRYLSPRGQPGVGDRFYFNVLASNPAKVERHDLRKNNVGEYADLPSAVAEAGFDPSDRKFAALAALENVPVVNATDSDWVNHRDVLEENGIQVVFLCGQEPLKWFAD